jgi:tetratricopeptide (TPR) repeat protein
VRRPWFEFENLSLSFFRPLIGYGPDLFRYTYMLESPPIGGDLLPRESAHAHNYFLHLGVENGFLGLLASLGIFAVPLAVGAYLLVRERGNYSAAHKLVLVGLLAIIAGRGLEQVAGLARVSDLTVFWVLLGVFAALPVAMKSPAEASGPRTTGASPRPLFASRSALGQRHYHWLGLFVAVCLVGSIGILTWMKTINYPRAAVIAAQGVDQSRSGNLEGALAKLEQAVELAPDVWINHVRLAAIYSAYRASDQVPREPGCSIWSDRMEYEVCLVEQEFLANLAGAEQRPLNFRSRHSLGLAAMNLAAATGSKNIEEQTLGYLREVAALVPKGWPLHNQLASAYLKAGRPEAAFEPLEKSLALTGDSGHSAKAYLARGVAYRELGQLLRAIEDFDEAVRIVPLDSVHHEFQDNWEAYNYRALTYLELGQPQQAIADLGEAIKSNSTYAEAFSNRGLLYRELGQPLRAIEDLDEAIRLDPQYPAAYGNRGLAFSDLGQYSRAIEDYDAAIRLGPTNVMAYLNRGAAYIDLGQPGQALLDSAQAIRLDPQHAGAYGLRALAHTLLGEDTEAGRDLEMAVELGFDRATLEGRIEELGESR